MHSNWNHDDFTSKTPNEIIEEDSLHNTSQGDQDEKSTNYRGDYLRVFWTRTLSCILSPICVSGYYAAIWAKWLNNYDDKGPVAHGPSGARWVYYVWFVLSAVGIGVSKYGLAGVEAAMLMDRRWAPNNAMQLIAHCDKTWSGPGGWASTRVRPHHTWLILAFVSLLPYVALPLSGFTLELSGGYASGGSTNTNPLLTGQSKQTLLDQNLNDVFTRSYQRWTSAGPSTLPGRSVYYVPRQQDGGNSRSWLQQSPNEWPDNQTITIFISPQSSDLVSGKVWGFQAQLDCREISALDQFELISQRNRTDNGTTLRCPPITYANSPNEDYEGLPDLCDFDAYLLDSTQCMNMNWAQLDGSLGSFPIGRMEIAVGYNKSAYDEENSFIDLSPVTIEAALWQNPIELDKEYQCKAMQDLLSNELGVTVEGLKQDVNIQKWESLGVCSNGTTKSLEAIGIQCKSAFLTGTATLDGPSGTYDSFVVEPPDAVLSGTPVPLPTAIPRLFHSRVQAALNLADGYTLSAFQNVAETVINSTDLDSYGNKNPAAFIASSAKWLQSIYRSVDTYYRQPMYCDTKDIRTTSYWQQMQLINSTQFLNSLLRVHKAYAIEMTKSRGEPFTADLTTVRMTSIISPGILHPIVVMVLLSIWTVCSVILGLTFGLRPRWSQTLDGFSMFRFGSDNPQFSIVQGVSTRDSSKCEALRTLPGLVGDATPDEPVGHITLVGGGGVARRRKKYL